MARAMTQTIAWGLATFMSGVVFASGYGIFKLMLPKDAQHSAQGSEHDHGADGHDGESHKEEGHAHDTAPEHPADDSHGSQDKAHGSDHGSAKGGHEEEEISADQFKHEAEPHH